MTVQQQYWFNKGYHDQLMKYAQDTAVGVEQAPKPEEEPKSALGRGWRNVKDVGRDIKEHPSWVLPSSWVRALESRKKDQNRAIDIYGK